VSLPRRSLNSTFIDVYMESINNAGNDPGSVIRVPDLKICLHCGSENELQRGQCSSCGRKEFTSRKKYALNKRSALTDIVISIFLVSMNLYLLYSLRSKLYTEKWLLAVIALTFFIAVGSLINSIYKYRHARNILIWHVIISLIFLGALIWDWSH
jgi:hypothetical protein